MHATTRPKDDTEKRELRTKLELAELRAQVAGAIHHPVGPSTPAAADPLLPAPEAHPTKEVRNLARNMLGGEGQLATNASWRTIRYKLCELNSEALGQILKNCDAPATLGKGKECRAEWIVSWLQQRGTAIAAHAGKAPAPLPAAA